MVKDKTMRFKLPVERANVNLRVGEYQKVLDDVPSQRFFLTEYYMARNIESSAAAQS